METKANYYPVGLQNFEKIRIGNYLYVDKTQFVSFMSWSLNLMGQLKMLCVRSTKKDTLFLLLPIRAAYFVSV